MKLVLASDLHSLPRAFEQFTETLKRYNVGIIAGDIVDEYVPDQQLIEMLNLSPDDFLDELPAPEETADEIVKKHLLVYLIYCPYIFPGGLYQGMKKPIVPVLVLTIASFTLAELSGNIDWSASTPSLQQVQNQISTWKSEYSIISATRFESKKMKEVFAFQSPSISHLSIPYLTLLDIQLEAASLKGHGQ